MGSTLAEKFATVWTFPRHLLRTDIPLMNFRFVGVNEILSLINSLNSNKSSLVLGVNTRYLKDALTILQIEFTHLINECLDNAIMPSDWSIGTVSPIPKNGLSHAMSDYRPISVLPSPSKIIERAVYNQLIYHLESHGLLDGRQHGFRKDHSTCTAIFELTQYLYNNLDDRKFTSCVFIDYSKAFDTIDHNILKRKLELYNLSPGVIAWCADYLSHRGQCVKVDDTKSRYKCINYGVPQRSILGPLFFIMYVNDLLYMFDNEVKILLYADDTVIYFADNNAKTACMRVEEALGIVHRWCVSNKLTINVKKTQHMLITPKHAKCSQSKYQIQMGECILQNVDAYNYLGELIDNEMIFDQFLKQKCGKINQRLYQLAKMRKFITSSIANKLYKQVILPLFDYADFLIESGTTYYINRLHNLHEKAVWLIDCNKHKDEDLSSLERRYLLESPSMRRKEHHCMIMYRLSGKGQYIDRYRPPIRLRSRKKVKFKTYKRNLSKIVKSPFYRGIKLWDMIPIEIQRSVTKVKFKRELKQIGLPWKS